MKLSRVSPLLLCLVLPMGCDNDEDGPPPEQAGQPCAVADECYPEVEVRTDLSGTVECLADRVPGGYCTHTCTTDADCCAVPGECRTGMAQVCSPLESAPEMYCMLSCEAAAREVAAAAGYAAADEGAYCAAYAGSSFGCRSSGGGSDNRRICSPN